MFQTLFQRYVMIEATPYLIDKRKEITSIQFIIRLKGHRLRFVPGIKVETKFWIDNNKWCKENKQYPDGYLNNIQIKKYKDIIEEVLEEFQKDLVIPTQEVFRKSIQSRIDAINEQEGGFVSDERQKELDKQEEAKKFISFAQRFKDSSDRKSNTLRSYQTTINKIKEYEKEKKITLKFEDITMSFYNDLKKHLIDNDCSKNYIGTIFKNILLFMGEAKEQGLCEFEKPKGFVVDSENADTISLTEEEISKIQSIIFTEELIREHYPEIKRPNLARKIKSLNVERDRFIIGYCTALRISDYSRIDDYNIEDNLIAIWTRKKDKKVYIPIHHYLQGIINKYNGLKLPKISDQKHNDQLKEICKISGIDTPIRKTITKGGERIEAVEPKHKFVTSHTARRSGATNMYRNGIDLLYISRLLGHSKIEQTVKYLKLTTKELAISLKDNPYFSGKKEEKQEETKKEN